MHAFIQRFVPDSLRCDVDTERKAILAVQIPLIVAAFAPVYSVVYYARGLYSGVVALLIAGVLSLSLPYVLRATGALRLVGHLAGGILYALLIYVIAITGGTAAGTAAWLGVVPLYVLMLTNRRDALVWMVLSIGALVGFAVAERAGVAFPTPEMSSVSSYAGLVIMVFLMARVFDVGKERALADVGRAREKAELQQRETEAMATDLEAAKASVEQQVEEAVREVEAQRQDLSASVREVLDAMERFADGNLSVRLQTERTDEIGRLYEGFNRAVEAMHTLLGQVLTTAEATASASEQISSSTEQLAMQANRQAAEADEVAAAVEEMARTIIENARTAQQSADAAERNDEVARESGAVVEQTVAKIREIAGVVRASAGTVEQLGASSHEIGQIAATIDEIADQTNLLALNAAIEAARAGEQGRGFAVVADEVRKLAERTTEATEQISRMIGQIQQETDEAVEAMQRGTQQVEEGIALADETGQALDEIVSSSQQIKDLIHQIAAASEQQSVTSESISESMNSITAITRESAEGVAAIARAADDMGGLTGDLRRQVDLFHLDEAVGAASRGDGRTGSGVPVLEAV